jgi:4-hydroxy-tetrahydrodipicolinate synthase
LKREIDFVFASGCAGVTLAMVSEITRLTAVERLALLDETVGHVSKRGPVICSVIAESSSQVMDLAKGAENRGATALLAALPLTYRVEPAQQEGFFRALLEKVGLPLILQDSSGYLGFPLSMDAQLRLWRDFPGRIFFKPESVPVGPVISRLIDQTGGEALIFDGTGGKYLRENFQRGVRGVLPGADTPWAVQCLWEALNENRDREAAEIQKALLPIFIGMHALDSYLAAEKFFLRIQGIFENEVLIPPASYPLDAISRRNLLEALHDLARLCDQSTTHWKSE